MPLRIIVVNDPALIKSLQEQLTVQVSVVGSPDGQDALERAQHLKPDLVVIDTEMPKMDGYHFVQELRKMEQVTRRKRAQVIVLSTRLKAKDSFDPKDIFGFIVKPFEISQLTNHILRLNKDVLAVRDEEGPRALVIGLDWDVIRVIKQFLISKNFAVLTATDSYNALEIGAKNTPQLILCASNPAGLDVFLTAKILHHMPATAPAPLLVYDSAGQFVEGGHARLEGVDRILEYTDHDHLLKKIEDYLLKEYKFLDRKDT